jgi:DNA polymerase-3 subunit gamma/tau
MLYRTYRPETWEQIVGQEHIVRTLRGALSSDRIGHAYLFAGPRGTGKTTIARIFARAIMSDESEFDLIEIDAASNRGIDDVRALKETAGTAPAIANRKVFIIDEVHMLSKEAFNALLKLLEEPPAHAVFILATTEAHKILPTVLSRVQRLDFKKLTQKQIADKLISIAKSEKMKLDDEAAVAIAAASDGALRDAEVMLAKLANHGGKEMLTVQLCQAVLGLVPLHWHGQLLGHLAKGDQQGAMAFLSTAAQGGVDADQLAKGFLEYLRQVMITKIDPAILAQAGVALADTQARQLDDYAKELDGKLLVKMIQTFTHARSQIKASPIAILPLELAVIEICST